MRGMSRAPVLGDRVGRPGSRRIQWIRRQVRLLDEARAVAVFQLTFTDLDLDSAPPPPGSILPLFAALGLVDPALAPKPAPAPWDSGWARPRELH